MDDEGGLVSGVDMPSGKGPSGGGYDGGMEAASKHDLEILRSEVKSDLKDIALELQKSINSQTWQIVTFVSFIGAALVAATVYIVAK